MILTMDGIKCFITSRKALTLLENKKYSFLVQRWLKKNTIKGLIENFFEVKVMSIHSCHLPRKSSKFNRYKTQYKKIIVTLDAKSNIQLFSNI